MASFVDCFLLIVSLSSYSCAHPVNVQDRPLWAKPNNKTLLILAPISIIDYFPNFRTRIKHIVDFGRKDIRPYCSVYDVHFIPQGDGETLSVYKAQSSLAPRLLSGRSALQNYDTTHNYYNNLGTLRSIYCAWLAPKY